MPEPTIDVATPSNPSLRRWLEGHPRARLVPAFSLPNELRFSTGGAWRIVRVGSVEPELGGLPELMDNNPLVCAAEVGTPDPLATTALICFGPLVRAGLLLEAPSLQTSFEASPAQAGEFLAREGWTGGLDVAFEPLEGPLEANDTVAFGWGMALVPSLPASEFRELFEECFGRSFFVRPGDEANWRTDAVRGTPFAFYRLKLSHEEPNSLLSVQVLADLDGKLGAAQAVHTMNVMAGVEETLGLL